MIRDTARAFVLVILLLIVVAEMQRLDAKVEDEHFRQAQTIERGTAR